MGRPDWAPEGIDIEVPSPARIYDYFLDGAHNFAVDRAVGQQLIAAVPDTKWMARENRAFLRRAVRFLVRAGVHQFLDLGSGVPTVGNVHEIAQAEDPDARVLYVDIDPVAVAHSRQILAGDHRANAIQADLRQPDVVLEHRDLGAILDLRQPVAVLLVSVLHFIPDTDNPADIIGRYRDALPAASYLVMSHLTSDSRPDDMADGLRVSRAAAIPTVTRSREQVLALFAGFDIVEPGVVWASQWHPEAPDEVGEQPERVNILAAAGRKD